MMYPELFWLRSDQTLYSSLLTLLCWLWGGILLLLSLSFFLLRRLEDEDEDELHHHHSYSSLASRSFSEDGRRRSVSLSSSSYKRMHVFTRRGCIVGIKARRLGDRLHEEEEKEEEEEEGQEGHRLLQLKHPTVVTQLQHVSEFQKTNAARETAKWGSMRHKTLPIIVLETHSGRFEFVGGYDDLLSCLF